MDLQRILQATDNTDLNPVHTWSDIRLLCDKSAEYKTASVCVAPCFVKQAKQYLSKKKSNTKVCTVVGFPNGYATTENKCAETANAIQNGADEIDMVVNLGDIKDMHFDFVQKEINKVKEHCKGRILKVIIETCRLTQNEKIKMCEVVSESNADFIKTSTGFGTGGATLEDIKLFKKYIYNRKQIKAAGGIKSLEDAEAFIENGASRLGSSSIVTMIEKLDGSEK